MQASPDTHQTALGLWLAWPPTPPLRQASVEGGPSPDVPLAPSTRGSCRLPGASCSCRVSQGCGSPDAPGLGPTPLPPGSRAIIGVAAGAPQAFGIAGGGGPPIPLPARRWEVAELSTRAPGPLAGRRAPFLVLTLTPWAFGVCARGPSYSCPPAPPTPAGLGLPRAGGGPSHPCPRPACSTRRRWDPCPADACSRHPANRTAVELNVTLAGHGPASHNKE